MSPMHRFTQARWFCQVVVLQLTAIAACMFTGCTSLYHLTLQEMALDEQQVLTNRLSEARDHHVTAREQFRDTFTIVASLREQPSVDPTEHAMLNHRIDRLRLETWNLRRRIASVNDVADGAIASLHADGPARSELMTQSKFIIEQMHTAHSDMSRVIDGLQQQAALLRAEVHPQTVSSLQPIAALTGIEQAHFIARVDEVIHRIDRFMSLLSASTSRDDA